MIVRLIDEAGNPHDVQVQAVPRIGERILQEFSRGAEPVREHFFRVKDVMHRLDEGAPGHYVSVLIVEETDAERWPG